jgi:hypothetical protein
MREAMLLAFGVIMFSCYSVSRLFEHHRGVTAHEPATVDLIPNPKLRCH